MTKKKTQRWTIKNIEAEMKKTAKIKPWFPPQ